MANIAFKGFVYGAVAAASYGLNPLFTLPLYEAGMNPDSVLFWRYAIAAAMLFALMKAQRQSFALKRRELLPLALMGVMFSLSSLTLFMSYNYMDAGVASTILFAYPVLVAVIMAAFFKEKVSALTALSIALASAGIMLLYRGEGGQTLSLTGVALVLASSLTYAVYIVGVNRSSLRDMPTSKLTFYAVLFGAAVFLARLKFGFALQPVPSAALWVNPVAMALFPTLVSLVFMTKSIHCIGSTAAAILGALEPITALAIGVAVFGEAFTARIAAGIALILAAVTLVVAGKPVARAVRVRLFHKPLRRP